MNSLSLIVISRVDSLRQLYHALNRVLLQEFFVIQVIVQYVQSLFGVINLRLERRWSPSFDTLEISVENLVDWSCVCRDVASITRCYTLISKFLTSFSRKLWTDDIWKQEGTIFGVVIALCLVESPVTRPVELIEEPRIDHGVAL